MSIRYGQFCPVAKAAEILGERWTILIIRELLVGTRRFTDLQRGLAQLSPTLLTKRLGQLQDCGLVVRKAIPQQRRAEYHLSAAGRELQSVVLGLADWGMKWARGRMSDEELDVELLMQEYSRRIDQTQLPGGRTVVQFVFTDAGRFGRWWVVLEEKCGTRTVRRRSWKAGRCRHPFGRSHDDGDLGGRHVDPGRKKGRSSARERRSVAGQDAVRVVATGLECACAAGSFPAQRVSSSGGHVCGFIVRQGQLASCDGASLACG